MKALVTGATGFVGSRLVAVLLKRGWDLDIIVRTPTPEIKQSYAGAKMICADLKKPMTLQDFSRDYEYVFHLAAVRDTVGKRSCFSTNVEGTENLMKFIVVHQKALKKIIYVSSAGASGFNDDGAGKSEDDPMYPVSFYCKTKMLSEAIIKGYEKQSPYLILRPCKIYGPGDKRLLLHFRLVKCGYIFDIGLTSRYLSLCYIDDFVNALIVCAESSVINETFFFSDGNAYSWKTFYDSISFLLRRKTRRIPIPSLLHPALFYILKSSVSVLRKIVAVESTTFDELKSKRWVCDPSKFISRFSFSPQTFLDAGLKDTADWYMRRGLI